MLTVSWKDILWQKSLFQGTQTTSSGWDSGNARLLPFAWEGNAFFFKCLWHILHSHSFSSTEVLPDRHICFNFPTVSTNILSLTSETDFLYNLLLQHIQTYSANSLICCLNLSNAISMLAGFLNSFFFLVLSFKCASAFWSGVRESLQSFILVLFFNRVSACCSDVKESLEVFHSCFVF